MNNKHIFQKNLLKSKINTINEKLIPLETKYNELLLITQKNNFNLNDNNININNTNNINIINNNINNKLLDLNKKKKNKY